MSLNWQWNDKMGEVIYKDGYINPNHPFTTDIYEGNALMIWVNHLPDDMYSLGNFCADMEHFRNMLGLNAKKGYSKDNLFNNWCKDIEVIRLNTKYKSVPKIVAEFAKAHTNVTIELYYEE